MAFPGSASAADLDAASRWWLDGVVYQVYPRSFADSNGDGVGDLPRFIDHLDYLAGGADSLGVDAIWLSPIYSSPMIDGGYDVMDHTAVDPVFVLRIRCTDEYVARVRHRPRPARPALPG